MQLLPIKIHITLFLGVSLASQGKVSVQDLQKDLNSPEATIVAGELRNKSIFHLLFSY